MLDVICFYFLLFLIYSFIGWSIEVVGKLIEKHRFINRGFLIGPICPIYGWGCLFMILLLTRYKGDPIVLFWMAILICSILEYFTSYFMEKLFHLRWWDYTRRKFNLNGRICAETMIPFGILGCLVIYIINPFFVSIINILLVNTINIIAVCLFIIYLIDNIVSLSIMFGFKDTIKTIEKDGTEEITRRVKEILLSKSYLYKRLVSAFPSMTSTKETLLFLQEKITNEINIINEKTRKSIKDSTKLVSDTAIKVTGRLKKKDK